MGQRPTSSHGYRMVTCHAHVTPTSTNDPGIVTLYTCTEPGGDCWDVSDWGDPPLSDESSLSLKEKNVCKLKMEQRIDLQ